MNWKYIAGYFDGEGTVGLSIGRDKRKSSNSLSGWGFQPFISLNTCDFDVIDRIAKFLTSNKIVTHTRLRVSKNPAWSDSMELKVWSNKNVVAFAKAILPHSISKRAQLYKIIQIVKAVGKKENRITGTRVDNFHRTYRTQSQFLRVMTLYDELSALKARKNGRKIFSRSYFEELFKEK